MIADSSLAVYHLAYRGIFGPCVSRFVGHVFHLFKRSSTSETESGKKSRFATRWQDDPDFFVSKWTPQAELLQDPSVKVVITHCGWGGTLETW